MTDSSQPSLRSSVFFCYADPTGFSGQKAATMLLVKGLSARGRNCRRLPQPVLDRSQGRWSSIPPYLVGLAAAWCRACALLVSRDSVLCVNLGLTRFAFVRDAVPMLLGRVWLGRERLVIALHGSLFMHWPDPSFEVGAFRFLLNLAGTITVLGDRQRTRLIALGVPENRIRVVVNSCELDPLTVAAVSAKHATGGDPLVPVRMLFLSSLIDSKGYPEYLGALDKLSGSHGPAVDAVLCGRLVPSEFSDRSRNLSEAEDWIEGEIARINGGERVRVRWVRGAIGAEKADLFRAAEIFVLPTRYLVEAQPLVLLEAMASGCAIVTTTAGEITTILDRDCAEFLGTATVDSVAEVLQRLAGDPEARRGLGVRAHARFVERYRVDRHLDAWEQILDQPNNRPGDSR